MVQSLWVREAAEYAPEGDHIICKWQDSEWIMSPAIAQTTVARLSKALAEWRVDQSGKVESIHAASS